MQRARTGAAARRQSASVTAASPPVLTPLAVAAMVAPQQGRSSADVAVPLEFVIVCLLHSRMGCAGRQGLRGAGPRASPMPRASAEAREKSAASESVKLADMHDVMASCTNVTRTERATMMLAIACR